MKKNFLKVALVMTVVATGCYGAYLAHNHESHESDLFFMNVEALSQSEGPTMLGCRYQKNATCYVFDGSGQLVDRRKNQYPGQ